MRTLLEPGFVIPIKLGSNLFTLPPTNFESVDHCAEQKRKRSKAWIGVIEIAQTGGNRISLYVERLRRLVILKKLKE